MLKYRPFRKQGHQEVQGMESWLPGGGYLRCIKVSFHPNATGRSCQELGVAGWLGSISNEGSE